METHLEQEYASKRKNGTTKKIVKSSTGCFQEDEGRFISRPDFLQKINSPFLPVAGTVADFNQATLKLYGLVPERYGKTLTLDNGSENVEHQALEKELGINVYFAKTYAGWLRGTNENTNGYSGGISPKAPT